MDLLQSQWKVNAADIFSVLLSTKGIIQSGHWRPLYSTQSILLSPGQWQQLRPRCKRFRLNVGHPDIKRKTMWAFYSKIYCDCRRPFQQPNYTTDFYFENIKGWLLEGSNNIISQCTVAQHDFRLAETISGD